MAAWQAVDSTAVEAYRWHDGLLELRFVDGAQEYAYACDEALLARFLAAASKGAFVNQVLKPLEQRERVRSQFALQAATFESPAYLFTDESILGWISGHVPVARGERVLDVAGGTGALGRRLADEGASAVVLDLVPEMLAAAPKRPDVLYVLGDAAAMPFADAQFDVVVTRFAVHHLDDPLAVFREMARVAADGARVAVIDMIDGGLAHNELERLRDPSHTAALSRETLIALLREAGFSAAIASEREQAIDGARWLAQAHGERAVVEAALRSEASGGPPTGLRARFVQDALQITHTWALVTGVRA